MYNVHVDYGVTGTCILLMIMWKNRSLATLNVFLCFSHAMHIRETKTSNLVTKVTVKLSKANNLFMKGCVHVVCAYLAAI